MSHIYPNTVYIIVGNFRGRKSSTNFAILQPPVKIFCRHAIPIYAISLTFRKIFYLEGFPLYDSMVIFTYKTSIKKHSWQYLIVVHLESPPQERLDHSPPGVEWASATSKVSLHSPSASVGTWLCSVLYRLNVLSRCYPALCRSHRSPRELQSHSSQEPMFWWSEFSYCPLVALTSSPRMEWHL